MKKLIKAVLSLLVAYGLVFPAQYAQAEPSPDEVNSFSEAAGTVVVNETDRSIEIPNLGVRLSYGDKGMILVNGVPVDPKSDNVVADVNFAIAMSQRTFGDRARSFFIGDANALAPVLVPIFTTVGGIVGLSMVLKAALKLLVAHFVVSMGVNAYCRSNTTDEQREVERCNELGSNWFGNVVNTIVNTESLSDYYGQTIASSTTNAMELWNTAKVKFFSENTYYIPNLNE